MADFVNTRDTMPGRADDTRARQTFDKLIAHELTEFKEDAVDWVRPYAFKNNNTLVNVELPTVDYNPSSAKNNYMFQNCTALKNVKLKGMTRTPQYAFSGCTALESVEMSDNLSYIDSYFLNDCPITIFDTKNTSNATFTVNSNAFNGSKIAHLILRSAKVATLSSINAFTNTPIKNGEGAVYVPLALLDDYKSATNWSQIAANIYPIEEINGEVVLRTHFGTISDTWEQILAAEQDGSYSTKYNVGDTKSILVDGKAVMMQIAAFDADTIAGGTEKAKISWVCKNCYDNSIFMNMTRSTTGGWPAMYMYTYLNDTSSGVYSKIESTVKNAIKTVVKPYWDAEASAEKTSNDKLWLLSNQEVNFITSGTYHKEDGGVTYSGLFPTASNGRSDNRVKYNNSSASSDPYGPTGPTDPSLPPVPPSPSDPIPTSTWWLRSSNSSSAFVSVNDTGSAAINDVTYPLNVVFGFCT